jgi:H+-transporting ATPase
MEIACILSIVLLDYLDFGLIIFLLFANATLGYWEEKQAGDAISALEASLSPTCIVSVPP